MIAGARRRVRTVEQERAQSARAFDAVGKQAGAVVGNAARWTLLSAHFIASSGAKRLPAATSDVSDVLLMSALASTRTASSHSSLPVVARTLSATQACGIINTDPTHRATATCRRRS